MFALRRPDVSVDDHRGPFSYPQPGMTRGSAPPGYTIDHYRSKVAMGRDGFERAIEALRNWAMFDVGWIHLAPAKPPLRDGATVGIVVSHLGFWSANFCRIVYVIEEKRTFGFAYGTLAEHAAKGEERITVTWAAADNGIWYDVVAFSRPRHPLALLGYPFTRHLQRRFGQDSADAMRRAVAV